MAKVSNELKTGIAVLVSLGVLCFALFKTGDIDVSKEGYIIKAEFKDVDGVKRFAPVRLAGLEVGEVRDIDIQFREENTRIVMDLWINNKTKVREDAVAAVSTIGLMGEKYVEIHTGVSTKFVGNGDTIQVEEPIKLDALIKKAETVMDEANATLAEIKEAARQAKLIMTHAKPKLENIFDNLDDILDDSKPKLHSILTNLDGLLDVNRPKIDAILENFVDTSEYFKEFSEDIKYHPWKVLAKGKEKSEEELEKLRKERLQKKAEEMGMTVVENISPDRTEDENKRKPLFGR